MGSLSRRRADRRIQSLYRDRVECPRFSVLSRVRDAAPPEPQRIRSLLDDDPIARTFPPAVKLTARMAVRFVRRTAGMTAMTGMRGIVRASLFVGPWRQWFGLGLAAMLVVAPAGQTRAGERPPAKNPKVDHAVQPAGGLTAGHGRCSQCQRAACPQCRRAEPQSHGHPPCQHGLCPAHCPVRPDVFGFYGTRWRRWPGSAVVQASNNEAATPARPPRAEVPGVKEESQEPEAAAEDLPPPAVEELPEEAQATEEPEPAATSEQREPAERPTAWRTFTVAPPRLAVQQ